MKTRILAVRSKNNMTQKEFAQKLGVGQSTVANWEQGRNEPSQEMRKRICKTFNVSLLFLEGNSDTMEVLPTNDFEMVDWVLSNGDESTKALIFAIAKYPKFAHDLIAFLSSAEIIRSLIFPPS